MKSMKSLFIFWIAINYEIRDTTFPEFFRGTKKILFLSKDLTMLQKDTWDYFIEFLFFFPFLSLSFWRVICYIYIFCLFFEGSVFIYVIDYLQCSWKKFYNNLICQKFEILFEVRRFGRVERLNKFANWTFLLSLLSF